jgi:hypothetical protein
MRARLFEKGLAPKKSSHLWKPSCRPTRSRAGWNPVLRPDQDRTRCRVLTLCRLLGT